VKTSESKFLDRFIYKNFRSERIKIHLKTLHRFKEQVRRLTNRNWGPIYIERICAISSLKPVNIYVAGLIILFFLNKNSAYCYQLCMPILKQE
jgi:RNA-directed DNA polymerase